jgi:hypothetical protein
VDPNETPEDPERRHAEGPVEGDPATDDEREIPREHSEDPAEG